jgi:hypothetical protein
VREVVDVAIRNVDGMPCYRISVSGVRWPPFKPESDLIHTREKHKFQEVKELRRVRRSPRTPEQLVKTSADPYAGGTEMF